MTTESRGTLSLARVLAREGDWVCGAARFDDGTANKAGSFLSPSAPHLRRLGQSEGGGGNAGTNYTRFRPYDSMPVHIIAAPANFAQSARFSQADMANL